MMKEDERSYSKMHKENIQASRVLVAAILELAAAVRHSSGTLYPI
jgi:hypothetical protein